MEDKYYFAIIAFLCTLVLFLLRDIKDLRFKMFHAHDMWHLFYTRWNESERRMNDMIKQEVMKDFDGHKKNDVPNIKVKNHCKPPRYLISNKHGAWVSFDTFDQAAAYYHGKIKIEVEEMPVIKNDSK